MKTESHKFEKGEIKMCEVFEQFARERMLNLLFECVQEGGVKIAFAAKKANLSLDEFKNQMKSRGFTIPKRKSRSAASARK